MSRLPARSARGRAPLALARPSTRTAQGAAVPCSQDIRYANEKRRGKRTAYLSVFGRGRRTWSSLRSGQLAAERHWRSLAPRHAVLEWMWEQITRSREGPVSPNSRRKSQRRRCWFGATGQKTTLLDRAWAPGYNKDMANRSGKKGGKPCTIRNWTRFWRW